MKLIRLARYNIYLKKIYKRWKYTKNPKKTTLRMNKSKNELKFSVWMSKLILSMLGFKMYSTVILMPNYMKETQWLGNLFKKD